VNAKLDTSTDPQVGFRPSGELEVATALAPFRGPFNQRHAAHLLRRAGFGGTNADVTAFAQLDAQRAVDALLHPAAPDVTFLDYPVELATLPATCTVSARRPCSCGGSTACCARAANCRKMTLFWHNHFATAASKSPPEMMAQQNALFRAQGLGIFARCSRR